MYSSVKFVKIGDNTNDFVESLSVVLVFKINVKLLDK